MRHLLIVLVMILSLKSFGQDPIFSQFFMVPESMNSSFTAGKKSTRAGIIHRTQWPELNFAIHTQFGFIDYWVDSAKSGFGIKVLNHTESSTGYQFVLGHVNYVHEIQLSSDWFFRPSLSFGLGLKDFGFQNLLLEDQVNLFQGVINPVSNDPSSIQGHSLFFDFGSSVMFYNDRSWVGISVNHLNRPNISMTEFGETPLDVFISLHGSVWVPFDYRSETQLYVLFNGMLQGEYNRLDLGGRIDYDRFSFGLLAATTPKKLNGASSVVNSVNLFMGLEWEGLNFGFSYDFNTTGIYRTGGVFELSLVYNFGDYIDCFGCPDY